MLTFFREKRGWRERKREETSLTKSSMTHEFAFYYLEDFVATILITNFVASVVLLNGRQEVDVRHNPKKHNYNL